jgi:hypothetical protein
MPHEIMLLTARALWKQATLSNDGSLDMERAIAASAVARDAAPYYAPKLASNTHSGPDGGPIPLDHHLVVEFVKGGKSSNS